MMKAVPSFEKKPQKRVAVAGIGASLMFVGGLVSVLLPQHLILMPKQLGYVQSVNLRLSRMTQRPGLLQGCPNTLC